MSSPHLGPHHPVCKLEGEVCWSLVPWTIETPAPSLPHLLLASPQISGKWFYIASASRDPEYHETAKKLQAAYFHLTPNKREDTIQLREYSTIDNQCYYDFSILNVQRDKGTLSKQGEGSPRAQSGCVEWGGCGRVSRQEGMRPKPLGLWTQRI
nr:PREDICTED: alpha-1-acid glycoprotein 2-like isoform X2 [Equus przewalskii]